MRVIDANTKDEILKAAREVFADVGYKEATIRQICKAAKTNVCLISYYYGGKEGLYRAVFEKMGEDRINRAQQVLGQALDMKTKEEYKIRLQLALQDIFATQVAHSDELIIIQRELMDGMPRVEDMVQKFIGNVRQYFIDFISYGIEKKFLKAELDPQLTAMSALNMIISFTVQLHFAQKEHTKFFFPDQDLKKTPERILKNFLPIFIDGVMNHES